MKTSSWKSWTTGRSISAPAYNKAGTVWNLTANVQVTEGITVFAQGRNLTNSRYEPANGFVIPGRFALAGLRFVF